MKIKFYTLLYIDRSETRRLAGKVYSQDKRIDVFVRNACILDRTLRLACAAQGIDGCTILTNDHARIHLSLQRMGYTIGGVKTIPFTMQVPTGISFYSAHFKIDAIRYFSTLSTDEYSVLLDNDVVCLTALPQAFLDAVAKSRPMNYTLLNEINNDNRLQICDICNEVDPRTMMWSGGEIIGGVAETYKSLVEKIDTVLPRYFEMVKKGLFHIGDEMPVSIAWQLLRQEGWQPVDAFDLRLLYRYWGNEETKSLRSYGTSLIHLPYDKVFLAKIKPDKLHTSDDFVKIYRKQRMRNFIVHKLKRLIGK